LKSIFFVPIYNQAEQLPGVLAKLRERPLPCDEVLLVDNGCSDGSELLVRSSGFRFIRFDQNRGVGGACIAAADWALANGYDVLGALAGNGKMLPSEMDRILEPIGSGKFDYVTGSRFLAEGHSPNLPAFRRTTIPLVTWAARCITGCRLTDATCGYRAYRLEILQRARFDWHATWLQGYSFEYYVYAKVLLSRIFRWVEVPITMRYPASKKNYSKIRPFTGWYDMLRPWVIARLDGKGFAT